LASINTCTNDSTTSAPQECNAMTTPIASSALNPFSTHPRFSVGAEQAYARPNVTAMTPDRIGSGQAQHDVDISLAQVGEAGPHFTADLNAQGGLEANVGLLHLAGSDGSRLSGFDVETEQGIWADARGETRLGSRIAGEAFGVAGPEEMLVRPELDILGFEKETSVSEGEAELGAQAYLVQGAFTLTESDPTRDTDVTQRFGLGVGIGAAGRLHFDDQDGDGYREYGFGVDAGPFSYDLEVEIGGIAKDAAQAWETISGWWTGGTESDAR
jgi:hypothetical protein